MQKILVRVAAAVILLISLTRVATADTIPQYTVIQQQSLELATGIQSRLYPPGTTTTISIIWATVGNFKYAFIDNNIPEQQNYQLPQRQAICLTFNQAERIRITNMDAKPRQIHILYLDPISITAQYYP